MKIALIGATGYVGEHLLREALERGHEVTAISRHAESVPEQHGLTRLNHDILQNPQATGELLSGYDVVIYAYNPQRGSKDPDIFEQHVRGHKAMLEAMRHSNCKRFLAVGGAASLKLDTGEEFLESDRFPARFEEFKPSIRGTRELYYLLKDRQDLDWVFLAPSAALVPGEKTGRYRQGKDHLLFDAQGNSTISLPDFAMAMLDEAEQPAHHRERFTVGY